MGNQTTSDNQLVNEGDVLREILGAIKEDIGGHFFMGIIEYLHDKIHNGEQLLSAHTFTSVSNGATVWLLQKTGQTKYLHSELEIYTVGQWQFTSYANPVLSDNGTELLQINRLSNSSYVPEGSIYHTPTITNNGTQRLQFSFGGGTNPAQATTGSLQDRLESVFAPNTDILIGLTNQSGATQYISVIANYYEE